VPDAGLLDDAAHTAAIERAYELIEAAQGEDTAGTIDVAMAEADERGWDDVRVLLHYAQSFAARYAGLDDSAHIEDMTELASRIEDPALYALALAHTAGRRVESRQALDVNESTTSLLVRAVGLLDGSHAPVVHRGAALIAIAIVSHALGLWELAMEQYDLSEQAYAADDDPRWATTVRRQRRAVAFNRVDVGLDWSSAEAAVGGWAAAERRAAAVLPVRLEALDGDWPPSWIAYHRCQVHLLAALAGPQAGAKHAEILPDGELRPVAEKVGLAIRAARAGDAFRAADLAADQADLLTLAVPPSARLLCMSIAARRPGTPEVAIAYADELATLRWNARIDQMTGVRDAIAVERRRNEHEQLRHDILVDELTGLANRRGYHTYLDGLAQPEDDGTDGYAVMMIDVDHFKGVNDTFGHDVGDLVLTRIAQVLAVNVRPVDLAARLGGDEFVVILANTRPGVPEARAQAILDAVREHPWEQIAPGLAVSISIGVHHGGQRELPSLLTDADRKLYDAKKDGRGRVAAHTAAA
jgi:diguanylate cyclase (GGDEF)-like protein